MVEPTSMGNSLWKISIKESRRPDSKSVIILVGLNVGVKDFKNSVNMS